MNYSARNVLIGSTRAARERENEALQTLSTEQARWLELNSRLDELERLLAPIPC